MEEQLYRQGDVLFRKIERIPDGERNQRVNGVLAEGEVTGHKHAIADLEAAGVFEVGEGLYLQVSEQGVSITHDEHKPISLPPGDYQVTIQREYTPQEIRSVAD